MNTKHTGKRWGVSSENPKIIMELTAFGAETNTIIGSSSGHPNSGFFPSEEEAIENAFLFAAAPELLEALQAILPWAQESDHGGLDIGADLTKARAAIAKASGASHVHDQ
ncbi:hypothetical protein LMG19089_02915 [Ralstonia edaphis]|uniref:hypothetical protein n=1 Tax=Ralstonia edaphi TaxID=3058599 RepID=UPI0028F51778|nr:hypothetical protein [Ralstonia sp. LMG 6871]CAJ0701740.1 hypothetical protein LMG19089_02915 [Ralstonia sp. LMG 6871]